jgi:sulfite reductase (ferredoxin)
MYPAYNVVAGAVVGTDAKFAEPLGMVSAFDLPRFTVDVLSAFTGKAGKYPSFGNYVRAEGKEDIRAILSEYKTIPSFQKDKNYYFDWGSDQVFSLASRGMGECSAGLFDMIDMDLSIIRESLKKIEKSTGEEEINPSLYKILFSSSRMLLITRGEEPKNEKEVFDAFINSFITAQLISEDYRNIVETGRDHKGYDFSQQKGIIIDLAESVIHLYDSMDDSMQFKLKEKAAEISFPKKPTLLHKKDLRGVLCPMNFVKTKIELSALNSGDLLEILLDNGEPIQNVPGSIRNEGHTILKEERIDDYWVVTIERK